MRVIGDKNQISEDALDFMISYLPFPLSQEPFKNTAACTISFSHNVFYPIKDQSHHSSYIWIVVWSYTHFGPF